MKDLKIFKIAGVGLVAFTLGFTLVSCGNKNKDEVSVNTQSQMSTEAKQPVPEEEPSFIDDPTIAMDKLLMLPEIMAYFENGYSIDNLQEEINIEGINCYIFGVTETNDSGAQVFKKYAVEKSGDGIYRLDKEPNGWVKVD